MSHESLTANDRLWLAELVHGGGTRAPSLIVRECRQSGGVVTGHATALHL